MNASRIAPALFLALALCAETAHAHSVTPVPRRELVRIQGYRDAAPADYPVVRQVTLTGLGELVPFHAGIWQVFGFQEALPEEARSEPERLSLQGERATVRAVTTARPEQRITILAERRPGAGVLFLLAVDLCPPE